MEHLYVCTDKNCWCLLTFDSIATHISIKHSSNAQPSQTEKENSYDFRGSTSETRKSTGPFSDWMNLIDTSNKASNKTLKSTTSTAMNPQCSKIKALSEVQTSIASFLTSTKQLYDNEISKLENVKASFEEDRERQTEVIRACKEKLFTMLLDFFASFEEVLSKRCDYSKLFASCGEMLEKMTLEKNEIDMFLSKFKNTGKETVFKKEELDKILQQFSANKFNLAQTEIFSELDDLMKKVKEFKATQLLQVDNSRLLAIYTELAKYIRVGEKNSNLMENSMKKDFETLFDQSLAWPNANAFEDLSVHFHDIPLVSNKDSVIFPMGKFENALHTFEEDSNKLHLFTIDSDIMKVTSQIEVFDSGFVAPRKHRSLRTQSGNIVLTGGIEGASNKVLNNCFRLLSSEMKIEEIAPMRKRRHSHGMVELGGYIYAMGGICDNDALTYCERLQLADSNGQWEEIAELNLPSYDSNYCVFNETTIYKFGGFTGKGRMSNKIEKYSVRENHWFMVNYSFDQANVMLFAQSGSAQIGEDKILIFGGRDVNNVKQKKTYCLTINKKANGDISYHISSLEDALMLEADVFNSNQIFCQDYEVYCLNTAKEPSFPQNSEKAGYQIMTFGKNQWRYI
mgnify:FL=1